MLAGRQSAARGSRLSCVRASFNVERATPVHAAGYGDSTPLAAGAVGRVSHEKGAPFLARRRYISTEISLDTRLNSVALICGDFAALLYSWLIPHAGDDAVVPHEAERIKVQVFPGRHDLEIAKIEETRDRLISAGLLEWTATGRLRFPLVSFYKYQTYIGKENRSTEERRETPGNVSSLSVSSSSSVSEQKETPAVKTASPRASKPKPDPLNGNREEATRLWNLQEKLRCEAIPGARRRSSSETRLLRIAQRLAGGATPEECEHVLRVYAARAKSEPSQAIWFNGETNWRADSFERASGMATPQEDQPRKFVSAADVIRKMREET